MLSQIRGIARTLLGATEEQRQMLEQQYLRRMARLGILPENATVDNILDLSVKDLMERRLQTMVFRAGLAKSVYQARQFVSHGHITVAGNIISVPGYIVKRDEESRIAFQPHSSLSNPQHPARAAPTGKRVSRLIEEAEAPTPRGEPILPEVKVPEIREEVQAEQPLELPEVEGEDTEETTVSGEETPSKEQ
jgi:ribosomal protein uS4